MPLPQTDSGVYEATFNIVSGSFNFRFYSAVGSWDSNSMGAGTGSGDISISMTQDTYSGSYYSGKDNWLISNWGGGQVKMTVNTNTTTVTFTRIGDIDYSDLKLYVVGDNINGTSWTLETNPMTYNSSDKTFVWEGAVLGCNGFKINDGSWSGSYNIGAPSATTYISLSTPYTYSNLSSSSDIKFSNTSQIVKNAKIVLDLFGGTLTVTGTLETMPTADQVLSDNLYVLGDFQGWDFSDSSTTLSKTQDKVYTGTVTIPAAASSAFRFYSDMTYGWNNFSYGANAGDDVNTTINSNDQTEYSGNVVSGKGNWVLSNWNGGTVDMTVNLNSNTVQFTMHENPYPEDLTFYVRGANVDGANTWSESTAALTYNSQSKTYVWEGESLGSGFKISDSATEWSGYNIGGSSENNIITLEQPFTYNNDGGSSNINFVDSKTLVSNPVLSLDLENGTLTLTGTEVEYTPKAAAIYYEGSDEPKFNLTASDDDPLVFTGIIESLTPEDSFKVVLDGAYWYSWGDMVVYSNVDAIKKLNADAEKYNDYSTITNANGSDITVTVDWENGTVTFAGDDMEELNPASMWLVGPFNDWTISNEDYTLAQTADNSGVYTGTFTLEETYETSSSDDPEIGAKFKIAFGTDWDTQSFGNVDSEGFNIYSSNTTVETNYAVNGPNWMVNNWAGGEITVTIDLNKQIVTIDCPDQPDFTYPENVYLMGIGGDWSNGYEMEGDGLGAYTVKVSVPVPAQGESAEFKVVADDVWYGPVSGANNIALKLQTPVEYEMVTGNNGNWVLVNWGGGDVIFTANFSEDGATLELNQTTGVGSIENALNGDEVIYNLQGIRVNKANLGKGLYIINGKKVLVK